MELARRRIQPRVRFTPWQSADLAAMGVTEQRADREVLWINAGKLGLIISCAGAGCSEAPVERAIYHDRLVRNRSFVVWGVWHRGVVACERGTDGAAGCVAPGCDTADGHGCAGGFRPRGPA
ncbi:hypothetical protein [Streptomyces hypolithicus]